EERTARPRRDPRSRDGAETRRSLSERGRARRGASPVPDRQPGRGASLHRAAVTISAIAIVGFAVGGTLAVNRVVRERDRAEYENQIATTRKIAAERLIDYMFTHVQT